MEATPLPDYGGPPKEPDATIAVVARSGAPPPRFDGIPGLPAGGGEFRIWYGRKLLLAEGMIAAAHAQTKMAPAEVVNETYLRIAINDPRYDKSSETDPEDHFVRCMKITIGSLKAKVAQPRKQRRFHAAIIAQTTGMLVDENDWRALLAEAQLRVTAAVNESRARGNVRLLAERLVRYSLLGYTTAEIAKDLNISEKLVSKIRGRIGRIVERAQARG